MKTTTVAATTKAEAQTEKTERKGRKATFIKVDIEGKVQFQPVNRRAQRWAADIKAKTLTKAQLKKGHRGWRAYQYASNRTLHPVFAK